MRCPGLSPCPTPLSLHERGLDASVGRLESIGIDQPEQVVATQLRQNLALPSHSQNCSGNLGISQARAAAAITPPVCFLATGDERSRLAHVRIDTRILPVAGRGFNLGD